MSEQFTPGQRVFVEATYDEDTEGTPRVTISGIGRMASATEVTLAMALLKEARARASRPGYLKRPFEQLLKRVEERANTAQGDAP